ncbi:glucose dehydrogenase [FAD, quinone]-like [Harmonia axyridis]|uniref:glucose dehydrogenase [FAD, quinone]-like n=1 Tax=Harmonia axyridis TaxID=115357 RepID=UPI001E27504A|nr:glucose dehydrogenase [FAD, quinone]-like [Harmonia axyridis]
MFKISIYVLLVVTLCNVTSEITKESLDQLVSTVEAEINNLRNIRPPYTKENEPEDFERELYGKVKDNTTYDFIVIGAGAAGATVTRRLAEIADWKILLLEAGEEETDTTRIPSLSFNLLNSKYNWGYLTTTQKYWCYGSTDKRCLLGMGKALGGSTAINGMSWARGNPKDYNKWADSGCPGWNYHDVLPYFKKLEDSQIKHYSEEHQGKNGPVHLENSRFESKATEFVLRAAYELNIPYVNFNAGKQIGIGHAQGTLRRGSRWSSARAYLQNAQVLPNLVIKPRSTVLKVLIDPKDKKASGVQYIRNGTIVEVHATKEVIISAGGMMTPKLLMLSGIGPKEELNNLGIETMSDLKVGKTLRTHLAFMGLKFIFNNTQLPSKNTREEIIEFLTKGKGPLSAFSADVIAYFNTEVSKDSADLPDVELVFSPRYEVVDNGVTENKLAVSVTVVLLDPKSVGSVKIGTNDPFHPPLIDPNFLSDKDEKDIATLIEGIRLAQKFLATRIFKENGGYLDRKPIPSCSSEEFDSDQYWRCAMRYQSICLSDPASTAKMGPTSDPDSVVDDELTVHRIGNLRIVDNSVIPVNIRGHMMAPAYMIGEKAADIIKNFWYSMYRS